ncbi:hypothetical protein BD94_0344 [Elizabethkingia anophelis NUHP1]|uniref:Uncharacterized protein n=1 Tax=Elizabethkingia anophelis NUHP1 TaxID=1338011 RepID=A0A077ED85_9FLAO|nr:hypothetical protein BD94_0344 [Elizabethkingia anophelis NUHP1]
MITKEDAYNKIKNYLDKSIKYSSIDNIDKIAFTSKDEMIYPISHGKYKGKKNRLLCNFLWRDVGN